MKEPTSQNRRNRHSLSFDPPRPRPISPPALLVVVWALLATAPLLIPITGPSGATFLVFIACTTLTLWGQVSFRSQARTRIHVRPIIEFTSALISGWALGPWLASAVVSGGLRLGWEPAHPLGPSLIDLVNTLVLAPVFEEILYRERLFIWLRINSAAPIALLISSLAFALPHPGDFSKLAAFAAGLILGTARSLSGGLLPCIGVHTGLNVFGQLAAGAFYPAILQRDLALMVAVPTLALSIFLSQTNRGRRR